MIILLSLFYFFYFAIVGVYVIFMPKTLVSLGYSAQDIGIVFSATPLIRFILPMFFIKGIKINSKIFNIALIALLIGAISFYFFIYNFYLLLFSDIMLGIGLSIVIPYIETLSLTNIGKEHYGRVRLFGSLGFVLVALLLVRILVDEKMVLNFLISLAFITVVVSYFLVMLFDKEDNKREEKISIESSPFRDYKFWLGLTLMQVSFGSFYNFFTIYETAHKISMQITIYLWSFGVLAEIVMLYFQGELLKKNLLVLLQITLFITAFRWVLVFLFPENIPILYFSQSLHAFSFALFHSAAISYLYELYTNKQLAQQFFLGFTYGLGGLIGSLLSGFIYENYPEYLFLSSAIIAFTAFISVTLYKKEKEKLLDKKFMTC